VVGSRLELEEASRAPYRKLRGGAGRGGVEGGEGALDRLGQVAVGGDGAGDVDAALGEGFVEGEAEDLQDGWRDLVSGLPPPSILNSK
jgi:hypothetical protein